MAPKAVTRPVVNRVFWSLAIAAVLLATACATAPSKTSVQGQEAPDPCDCGDMSWDHPPPQPGRISVEEINELEKEEERDLPPG